MNIEMNEVMDNETIEKENTEIKDPKFGDFLKNVLKPVNEEEEKTPEQYAVLLHNDHTTPFYIVTTILRDVFKIPRNRAELIMQTAHFEGTAVVAIMAKEEAEQKIQKAAEASAGLELRFTMEKETD